MQIYFQKLFALVCFVMISAKIFSQEQDLIGRFKLQGVLAKAPYTPYSDDGRNNPNRIVIDGFSRGGYSSKTG